MQDIQLKTTLPTLSFDFEGLKTWALACVEKYEGLVVQEDDIVNVKRDMAEINRTKKTVDDARKEVVRRVSEPIKAFEAQTKEVCAIFDRAYVGLGDQVKVFEDRQREEKREAVQQIVHCMIRDADIEFEIPIQEKWLNKTTTLKNVREDVQSILVKEISDRAAHATLERAKAERVAIIEQAVKAANIEHSLNMTVSMFMRRDFLSLDTPLEQALNAVQQHALLLAADRQKRAQQSRTQATTVQEPATSPVNRQAAPAECGGKTLAMSIVIEYDLANEAQVQACLKHLKRLCSSFGSRTR